MDWLLYDRDIRQKRVKSREKIDGTRFLLEEIRYSKIPQLLFLALQTYMVSTNEDPTRKKVTLIEQT